MTPLIREIVSIIGDDASDCAWFDISGCEQSEHAAQLAMKYAPLPFDRCSVVFADGDDNVLLHLWQRGSALTMAMHILRRNDYKSIPAATVMTHEGERKILPGEAFPTEAHPNDFRIMRNATGWFLSLLDNPVTAYRPTPKRSPTNARRIAKGKPPLVYDWHTVLITPSAKKQDHQGGTHASPRRHQCRGHWRNLKSGKRVWVKECWKGDASKGTSFHDYKVAP